MKFVYFKLHFIYPMGKPMAPHLLCCQGFAVEDYSFALGRLVVAKRKSRRRGSWGTLDFRSFKVLLYNLKLTRYCSKIKLSQGR